MLSPKELNFCKDVAADILGSSDNFSWIQEWKYWLNGWKSLHGSDRFWNHRGPKSLGPENSSFRGFEAEPWPSVPPYTLSVPAGSVYPGTVRCVPDMLGGQRCHAD